MAISAAIKLGPLPSELWAEVLRCLTRDRDIVDLWTRCRPVCKAFKTEVETIFRDTHLPKTWISFELGGREFNDDPLDSMTVKFKFSHLSEDKSIATFDLDTSSELEHRGENLKSQLRDYVERINDPSKIKSPIHTVQIRRHINDSPIPGLSVDYEKLELSCDWCKMCSGLLYEEDAVVDHSKNWVAGKMDWAAEMRKQTESGQLDMGEAIMKAIEAYGNQHKEGSKQARRTRLRHQIRAATGKEWSISEQNSYADEETLVLERLSVARQTVLDEEYSDDELEDEDEDDYEEGEDEEEDEGEDEDDEWEDADEDDSEGHFSDDEEQHSKNHP